MARSKLASDRLELLPSFETFRDLCLKMRRDIEAARTSIRPEAHMHVGTVTLAPMTDAGGRAARAIGRGSRAEKDFGEERDELSFEVSR